MNILKGMISDIRSHEGISLVKIKALDENVFTAVVIDTPETASSLKTGGSVRILFKETEVMIAKGDLSGISIQNRLPCTVRSINKGAILCELELLCEGATVRSVITSNACEQLKLAVNDVVIALIKSNEISLAYND